MITIGGWIKIAETELTQAGISSARLDALILLERATNQSREQLLAHADEELHGQAINTYRGLLDQRKERIPLVHLTRNREFYGLDLEITPDVLTPRAETEQMVEWAIKYAPIDSRLIDIGTGSGAIAIAIAKHRPDLQVWATEVTTEALAVAKRNADKHNLNINFIQSDLFDAFTEEIEPRTSGALRPEMVFETVVTNLPYLQNDAELMPEVLHEPAIALFGGDDGLDLYRRFLTQLPAHLTSSGYLFTECDPWQQEKLIEASKRAKLAIIEQGYFIMGFVKQ